MVYWFEKGRFLVLTGMPRPVLGESCTTSIKDFAIFPPHKKKKNNDDNDFSVKFRFIFMHFVVNFKNCNGLLKHVPSIFINGIVFSCHPSKNDTSYYDSSQNSGLFKMKPLIGKPCIILFLLFYPPTYFIFVFC